MKLTQLNEATLVEREIGGKEFGDITITPAVQELINGGNWADAYRAANIDTTGKELEVIFVDYQPSEKDNLGTSFEMKKLGGFVEKKSGYLQETDETTKAGGFLKLQNIKNLGTNLTPVYKLNTTQEIRPGHFHIVTDKTKATKYSAKDAKDLVSKLSGIGSGIKTIRAEKVQRQSVGKTASEQEEVVRKFIEAALGQNYQQIQGFEDLVIRAVSETGLKTDNPIIVFLKGFLTNNTLTRHGFIVLNNLYAHSAIDARDFSSLKVLYSDLLTKSYDDAETIVETYKWALTTWEQLDNKALGTLFTAKGLTKLQKSIKTSRQEIADALVYEAGQIGKKVEDANKVLANKESIRVTSRGSETVEITRGTKRKPGTQEPVQPQGKINISVAPKQLTRDDISRYDNQLRGLTPEEVPTMITYLKNKGLIK